MTLRQIQTLGTATLTLWFKVSDPVTLLRTVRPHRTRSAGMGVRAWPP